MPIAASDARGPGTKLRDGWVVPDGAVLAGVVLPTLYPPPGDPPPGGPEWHATLAIDGPLATVMRSLREQARRSHWQGGGTCEPFSQGHAVWVTCESSYGNGHDAMHVFASVDTDRSMLLMTFSHALPRPCTPSSCSDEVPTPRVTPRFESLPRSGRAFTINGGHALERVRVVPGSHAVAQWDPDAFMALIRVDAAPERIVDAYVRQLRADIMATPYTAHATFEGWQVRVWSYPGDNTTPSVTEFTKGFRTYVELER